MYFVFRSIKTENKGILFRLLKKTPIDHFEFPSGLSRVYDTASGVMSTNETKLRHESVNNHSTGPPSEPFRLSPVVLQTQYTHLSVFPTEDIHFLLLIANLMAVYM